MAAGGDQGCLKLLTKVRADAMTLRRHELSLARAHMGRRQNT